MKKLLLLPFLFFTITHIANADYNFDNGKVYYDSHLLENADIDTFEEIGYRVYAKDKDRVYYKQFLVENADPETFVLIGNAFAKDKNYIFVNGQKIDYIDLNSFQQLKYGYATDKNHAYFYKTIIENADPDTFEILHCKYAKDKNAVYYQDKIIEEADPNSFREYFSPLEQDRCYSIAKDKNNFYSRDQIVDSYFIDVENHQYKEAINYLAKENIIAGYADLTFRPDNQINRAEFTKIIIDSTYPGILDKAICDPNLLEFSDLNLNEWYAPYICLASKKGIIQGYPDGTFKPEQNINLVEGLKIIYETKKITLETEVAEGEWYEPFFTQLRLDSSEENAFYDQVNPDHLLTRGESAFLLDLVMDAYSDKLFWPAEGEISEAFGEGHYAIDIANRSGSLIYAASDGEVIKSASGWNGGYGNMVIIDHGEGLRTLYAHLEERYAQEGDQVKKGEILGKMGDTGRTTEVKLYFEVIQDEEKKDPLDYLQ
jgi:hypothetical protein